MLSDEEVRSYQAVLWEGVGNEQPRMAGAVAESELVEGTEVHEVRATEALSAQHHFDAQRLRNRFGVVVVKRGWELLVDAQERVLVLTDPKRHSRSFGFGSVCQHGFSSRRPAAVYFEVDSGAENTTYHVALGSEGEVARFRELLSAPSGAQRDDDDDDDDDEDEEEEGEEEEGEEEEEEGGEEEEETGETGEEDEEEEGGLGELLLRGGDEPAEEQPLLMGERVVADLPHAARKVLNSSGEYTMDGSLRVTSMRVMFRASFRRWSAALWLCEIASAAREGASVVLRAKTVRTLVLQLQSREAAESLLSTVLACTFPPQISLLSFALAPGSSEGPNGWDVYSARQDLARMGAFSTPQRQRFWRLLENEGFQLCASYPRQLLIPAALSESSVMRAAAFRSKQRIPVVTWLNHAGGNVLARSAQPMVGIKLHRCSADEQLLELYHHAATMTSGGMVSEGDVRPLYVFDARRVVASTGNRVMGKGVETSTHYPGVRVVHLGLHNIHEVRRSFLALSALVQPGGSATDDKLWFSRLEETSWLKHLQRILSGSVRVAQMLQRGSSVIVHCSDGWDRTPQLCATAQLLVDPFYRTLRGFMALVEKEWCSFGHKFADRTGSGLPQGECEGERSPVMLQWLDVVHQVLRQLPFAFEFTEALLLHVADAAVTARYGTFLGNCAAEREAARDRTESCWTPVLADPRRFSNPGFRPQPGAVAVAASMKKMVLWEGYFFRFDPESAPLC